MRRGALVQQVAGRVGGCDLPSEEGAVSPGVVHQSLRLGCEQSVPDAASPLHRDDCPLQLHPCSI